MATKPLTDEQRAKARERARVQNARPEVKARKAEYQSRPEVIAARAAYYQRPEVKARYKARNGSAEHKEYCKEWRASEKGKAATKATSLKHSTDGTFTLELWRELSRLQGDACAICRRPFGSLGFRDIHADHCHDEQEPRGLLCRNCNHAEGQIKKTGLSPEDFGRRLALYLANPPASAVGSPPVQPNESAGIVGSKELS